MTTKYYLVGSENKRSEKRRRWVNKEISTLRYDGNIEYSQN